MKLSLFILFCFFLQTQLFAKDLSNPKGLLPELKLNEDNELENQKKLVTSETMIQNSEIKAIEALNKIIRRKRNTPEEPDLLFRLGELHLKRAHSQRNLDLAKSSKINHDFKKEVQTALDIFKEIEHKFTHFQNLDSVLFTHAFASNQVGLSEESLQLYKKILTLFPNSTFIPDATLELGEIYYSLQKYGQALEYFQKIENYPTASVYIYGKYKAAWTLYNLHKTKEGMNQLIEVANKSSGNDESRTHKEKSKHNLRKEALRDITIFASEVYQSQELYPFFKKISREDELGPLLIDLGKLYFSHSKYKEALIFLKEFTSKEKNNSEIINANNIIIESLESLKNRTEVIQQLAESSQLCQWKSDWRKSVPIDIANESCKEFKNLSYEISSKWWDIWLKNKAHQEFSNFTLQAFKIIVENDDPKNPDLKAHYAYAELLFQLKSYDESSSEYLYVGKRTEDLQIKHDANYSALFAKEKKLAENTSEALLKDIHDLSINYITTNPNGKYVEDVKFKLGISAYERNAYEEALSWLMPLMNESKSAALKIKSQDLYLDILNLKKEYKLLKETALKFSKNTTDTERQKKLTKIQVESSYNEVQTELKEESSQAAKDNLKKFIAENPDNELSKKSQWQLVGLLSKEKNQLQANEAAMDYCQKYTKEPQCLTIWQEVADKFIDLKLPQKAVLPLEKLIALDPKNKLKYAQSLASIYIFDKQEKPATQWVKMILAESNKESKKDFVLKFYPYVKGETQNFQIILTEFKKEILNFDIEPMSTQFLIEKAQTLYASHKFKEAFELSLKILKRESSLADRAPARLIQAQILQQEFQQQSVKAKSERLTTVLSLKTEKLDKAQQAYIGVLNMSQDPKTTFTAMKGLESIYNHFTDAILNLPMPTDLSDQEQNSFKKELQLLAQPILEKSKDLKVKIEEFSKKYPLVLETTPGPSLSLKITPTNTPFFSYKLVILQNNLNNDKSPKDFEGRSSCVCS